MIREAFQHHEVFNPLHVAKGEVEAMEYLRVPEKSKADPDLDSIPVVILITSRSDENVARTCGLQANCITQPVGFSTFVDVVRRIGDFWPPAATLPIVRS